MKILYLHDDRGEVERVHHCLASHFGGLQLTAVASFNEVTAQLHDKAAADHDLLLLESHLLPAEVGRSFARLRQTCGGDLPIAIIGPEPTTALAELPDSAGPCEFITRRPGYLQDLPLRVDLLHSKAAFRRERRARAEAEAHISQLCHANPAIFYRLRWDGAQLRALWVSDNITEILGYSVDEALQENWWVEHVVCEAGNSIEIAVADLFERGRAVRQYGFRDRSGAVRWIRDEQRLLPDGHGGSEVVGIWNDITEQHQRELQLDLRQAALEAAANAIVLTDTTGTIQWANQAFCQLSGYSLQEAVGMNPRQLVRSGRQSQSFYEQMWKSILSGEVWCGRMINRRKDGSLYTEEMTITPVRQGGAGITHFIAIKNDISERVRMEETHARLEAELRLSQRMEALGSLSGGIAHEFNNIVATILGNLELARQDVGDNHAAGTSLEEIRKAGERAKRLVQRILSFARPPAMVRSALDLEAVVRDSLPLLRALLPAGIDLVTNAQPGVPTVLADPTHIDHLLMNLCTNAWQAMPGKTGRIEIDLKGVEIDPDQVASEAGLDPGRFAVLSVSDDGSGMTETVRAQMFDPFFTTKAAGTGSGLGLPVVHTIVHAHNGVIRVRSTPGKGTTVSLYFPAAPMVDPVATAEPPARRIEGGHGQMILYLDDEEPLVFLVQRLLERAGYRVDGHTDADSALAALRATPDAYAVVVTDFNMPGKSGLDVGREIKRLRPNLPVILVSGYFSETLLAEATAAGIDNMIYKPNTAQALCEAVRELAAWPSAQ